jgi:hypothetical protein
VTELQLHQAVAEMLRIALVEPATWTTFPAGWGKLGKATAGSLKHCGLMAGMPDILVFYGFTLGIELKVPSGRLSKIQESTFSILEKAGIDTVVCTSTMEAYQALLRWEIPVRTIRFQDAA